jgi:hypothetical protein
MKTLTRMLAIALLMACVLAVVPNQVRADEKQQSVDDKTCLQVVIKSANYCDLDNDGSPDDVSTRFQISVVADDIVFHKSQIYCFLSLPSGKTFALGISVKGTYVSLAFVIGWLNVVNQSGWYVFSVCALLFGGPSDYFAYSSIAFDPPTGGDPGPPLIQIMSVEILY